jgi:hypothetical protein
MKNKPLLTKKQIEDLTMSLSIHFSYGGSGVFGDRDDLFKEGITEWVEEQCNKRKRSK